MSYTDRIPYEGKDAVMIVKDLWRRAEDAHTHAQDTGDYNDYLAAAELYDELNGQKAEKLAEHCRKTARLLLNAEVEQRR